MYLFFHELWLSVEHHERNSIRAPYHNEDCLCFDLKGCSGELAVTGIQTHVLMAVNPLLDH